MIFLFLREGLLVEDVFDIGVLEIFLGKGLVLIIINIYREGIRDIVGVKI